MPCVQAEKHVAEWTVQCNISMLYLQCYRKHQLTVACYVSNIIRVFILRYLQSFQSIVLDNTTNSTRLRWPAVYSRSIRTLWISMTVLDTFMPQQCEHTNSSKQWHSKRLKICSAIKTMSHHCRMNGSTLVTISWNLYDFWEIVKKSRAFRV